MGACIGTKKEVKLNPAAMVQEMAPHLFVRDNFKFTDYTRSIGQPEDMDALEYNVKDFRPSDIRCMRDADSSSKTHSYVVIAGNSHNSQQEIGLKIHFTEKGFRLTMGDIDMLPQATSVYIEKVHFPNAEARQKGGFRDIVRWAYQHRDELYVDPEEIPELNMGVRVFDYAKSLVSQIKGVNDQFK